MMKDYAIALEFLKEYIRKFSIDYFVFPRYISRGMQVIRVDAHELYTAVSDYIATNNVLPDLLEIRRGEQYFRLREQYTATKMFAGLNIKPIDAKMTDYKRIKDIPKHFNSYARGFEIVAANVYGAIHKGDDISSYDILFNDGTHGECKIGKGLFCNQSKRK